MTVACQNGSRDIAAAKVTVRSPAKMAGFLSLRHDAANFVRLPRP